MKILKAVKNYLKRKNKKYLLEFVTKMEVKMSDKHIKQLYEEIGNQLGENYKIILEPGRSLTENWIEYDQVEWKIEEQMEPLVQELKRDNQTSFEDKVLKIYKYICLNYIYDDNVLFFFRKDASDPENVKYIAVDWYGRIVGKEWIENRKKHNRRICYEFSRFYAKAINELIESTENMEAVMVGDIDNLHYFTVLTGNEYSVILDLDDFNKIKDLTRLKLGLTIDGIRILRDDLGKFQEAVKNFNKGRTLELEEVSKIEEDFKIDKDYIKYFSRIIEVLRKYKIDSQGFMEYMRSKVENEGIDTEKVWRKIEGDGEKRHVRCLTFSVEDKTYLIDTVDQVMTEINIEDIDKNKYIIKPEENEYPYYGG